VSCGLVPPRVWPTSVHRLMEMPPSRLLLLAIHFVNGPKKIMVLPATMNWTLIRRPGRQPSSPLLVHELPAPWEMYPASGSLWTGHGGPDFEPGRCLSAQGMLASMPVKQYFPGESLAVKDQISLL